MKPAASATLELPTLTQYEVWEVADGHEPHRAYSPTERRADVDVMADRWNADERTAAFTKGRPIRRRYVVVEVITTRTVVAS